MPPGSQLPTAPRPEERRFAAPRPHSGHEPRLAFRAALGRYKGTRLAAIRLAQGASPDGMLRIRSSGNADEITDHLDHPAAVQALIARLTADSRIALGLFGLTEASWLTVAGLSHSLRILESDPVPAIVKLLELGLVAVDSGPESGPVDEFSEVLESRDPLRTCVRVHPAVSKGMRTARPAAPLPRAEGPIEQIREPDGLEAILRLAALWQRVGAEPLRQTGQGALYKRDRDRIDLDPVLKAPITDAFTQLSDSPAMWLALASRVGLIALEAGGERLLAASPEFWTENAFHLPQMIATGWLGLQTGYELHAEAGAPDEADSAVPYLRPALLLWLSTLGESEWVSLDDLGSHLTARLAGWNRLSLRPEPLSGTPQRRGAAPGGRTRVRQEAGGRPKPAGVLEAILLGAAYPLGLIRTGEESSTGRRVVQLSSFGRYVLAVGPAPPPRPAFEKFLFVQPNFEVIAYRQGLTAQLVGRLSRFVWWTQIGSALELKLSRESIVHGLDFGSKPAWMIETLTRHSQHPLSRGVIEAINNWAERRERVIIYAATTLMEFGSEDERDRTVELWPVGDHAPPVAVAARFLLVEDDRTVPFDRLRMTSSRDYRRPAEACVTVERDGISLTLDPARADLLIDAELAQFADPVALFERDSEGPPVPGARRFTISGGSLRRGISRGMSVPRLNEWFERRTGGEIPPSVQLLLTAKTSRLAPLRAARMIVLTLADPELLKGLRQHPATSDLLGDSLGPSSVAIPENQVVPLQKALKELGITLEFEA